MYEGNARENECLVQGSSYRESTVHAQCTCIPPALCHLFPFEMGFLHVQTCTYLWEILHKHFYRVLKCDVIRNQICEITVYGIFWGVMKKQYPKGPLSKN